MHEKNKFNKKFGQFCDIICIAVANRKEKGGKWLKKLRWDILGYIVLLILAGTLLYHMCRTTNQAMTAFVVDTEFVGEYTLGDSEWKPLEENTRLSSFDGDLVLRGRFSEEFPMYVSFHLNHIGVIISVNGEEVFESNRARDEIPEMVCGSYWSGWLNEDAHPEDIIEIRLHNPHSYGNAGAYEEFLNSLHFGAGTALENHLEPQSRPYRIAGSFMLVAAVALLGMALGYFVQRLPQASLLGSMGLLTLFMGGYILMDTIDIDFRSKLNVLNTCVRQCCIMFAVMELANGIRKILTGNKYKIAGIITAVLGVSNGVALLFSFTDKIALYDTSGYLSIVQGIASLVLLWFCIQECRQRKKENRVMLISGMILLLTVWMELVNARMNLWTSGIIVKTIFFLIFVFHLFRAIKMVAMNHRDAGRVRELSDEIKNSRIVLAMSQIRTHFIFNILTAISGMCEYDPKKADEVLIRFSRYLRNNIDIMQEDGLETFSKSMEHLEDYIVLEQLRFDNRLQFVKQLEVTNFQLPPLILQPIVENSIKHGLFPKPEGGTITLRTQVKDDDIEIAIMDDGVGYDMSEMKKEESVGLDNVRFRLKYMVKGRMDIESSPGNGTKVTIIIPRKEASF